MRHKYFKITLCLFIFSVVLSCAGCNGYTSRIPNGDYEKMNKIVLGIDGKECILEAGDDLETVVTAIKKTLKSGKKDWTHPFDQVKMSHSDFSVSFAKEGTIWFEIFMDNGKYKKIFFTMDLKDTQTLWIYSTTTDSYDDGNFLEYYQCDCRELVALINSYKS